MSSLATASKRDLQNIVLLLSFIAPTWTNRIRNLSVTFLEDAWKLLVSSDQPDSSKSNYILSRCAGIDGLTAHITNFGLLSWEAGKM